MNETFDAYFPELMKHEGGYVDHPRDPGGATKYGITLKTLESWRGRDVTKNEVRQLSRSEAADIYRARYWHAIGGDDLPCGVDAVALDIAVNHGVGRWKQWVPIIKGLAPQDAVRALCERRRRFYRSLNTYPTFGKGWMRRANSVEAWALKWASERSSNEASKPLPKTMKTSKTGGAAILTGAGGAAIVIKEGAEVATQVKDAATDVWALAASVGPWVLLGVAIIGFAGFIWWDRRRKMREHGI